MDKASFEASKNISFTDDFKDLKKADFVIIAVPTPVTKERQPDLSSLKKASEQVGRFIKKDSTVIFESTVYPGVTEEICVPIIEHASGMKNGPGGFKVGYSPERVNPGDKEHTLEKIIKVVSGQDEETTENIAWLYSNVVAAGVYKAPSIKVAEAAKVIENIQRDLNIALVNEFATIFNEMDLDTNAILKAAGTKWNFSPYKPGLVGGHCIGVDPYYLTHKAELLGLHPELILAGRAINDGMAKYVATQTVKKMVGEGINIAGSKVLVAGLSFKENCSDLRNSKVVELISELKDFGCDVIVNDPISDPREALKEYGIKLTPWDELPNPLDTIVLAVPHQEYVKKSIKNLCLALRPSGVIIDVKSALDPVSVFEEGYVLWRL